MDKASTLQQCRMLADSNYQSICCPELADDFSSSCSLIRELHFDKYCTISSLHICF